jgi:UDP-N-acetylmuramoylalanine-D-glutamate ligase
VKSPGIPDTAPIIQKIKAKNIPVISEIEFAGRYTDAKMVCITGSNGKTTTTMLTYHILKDAGLNVGLAGNVGTSLAYQVATANHDVYVIELSSFQLDNMYDFKANIAVLLNITPDHLDRYNYEMQNYVNAKFRILQNQTKDDSFIYWEDDPPPDGLQLQCHVRECIHQCGNEDRQLAECHPGQLGDGGIYRGLDFRRHRQSQECSPEVDVLSGVPLYRSLCAVHVFRSTERRHV